MVGFLYKKFEYKIGQINLHSKRKKAMFFGLFFIHIYSEAHPLSVEITKENVFDIIGKTKHVYVHFFSKGCRHCAKMAPEWNELVRIYHPIDEVVLATINCDRWSNLCFSFDGTSTPSIQHFSPRERKGVQYGGDKTLIPMSKWIIETSSAKPYVKPKSLLYAKTIDEINASLKENGQVLIVVDDPRHQIYNQTEIREAEGATPAHIFAISKSSYPQEAELYCEKDEHCIVLINGNETIIYDGPIESSKILDFIDEHPVKEEL